jgi:hypothetical protein
VPANELLGLGPGEVFVQRNVGNLATHKDMNVMSCMEYAVTVLKVKHIIVCGHYGCGAVKGALTLPCKTPGLVNLWIQDIRDTRDKNIETLRRLKGPEQVGGGWVLRLALQGLSATHKRDSRLRIAGCHPTPPFPPSLQQPPTTKVPITAPNNQPPTTPNNHPMRRWTSWWS